jgi:3-hydroxybutyryl-CoA dehydrogenase
MTIKKVGVLGCGLMGAGITEVCAKAGFSTVVREVDKEFLEQGMNRIERSLSKAVDKGRLDAGERDEALARISGTTELEPLADCDLVIEAIIESLQVKVETFAALDKTVQENAIFASNTSSLTITQIAMATQRTDRFVGLHFFNPVPVMKLVWARRGCPAGTIRASLSIDFWFPTSSMPSEPSKRESARSKTSTRLCSWVVDIPWGR